MVILRAMLSLWDWTVLFILPGCELLSWDGELILHCLGIEQGICVHITAFCFQDPPTGLAGLDLTMDSNVLGGHGL